MPSPIAEAVVTVRADTKQFAKDIQAAVASIKVPPVRVPVTAGAAGGAAGGGGGITAVGASGAAASRGIDQATRSSNALRGALIGVSRVTPVTVFGLGLAGTAGIAAGLGFAKAIGGAAAFEEQMNVLNVVLQPTASELERISELAKELGGDVRLPAVSAGDAAQAMTELAKAGLDVEDTMGGVRGVLQLATAAEIDNAAAAKIAASALNAFALEGEEATRVADLLAASAIASQGEIVDMAAALAQTASVAATANISIEDTATALSLLAKNGLLGSDAGTSLRTTILRLVPTTKEARDFVEALGISFADAQGNLRPLPDLFEQYRIALSSLSETQQQATLTQIFGQDAIRAASILTREGAVGFEQMSNQVERQGAAAELAEARTKGLSGAVGGLVSSLETLGTTLGGVVIPGMSGFIRTMTGAVGLVNDFAGFVGDLIPGGETENFRGNTVLIGREIEDLVGRLDALKKVGADEFVTDALSSQLRELQDEFIAAAIAAERFSLEDFGPETQQFLEGLGIGQRIQTALRVAEIEAAEGASKVASAIRNRIPQTAAAMDALNQTLQQKARELGTDFADGLDEQLFQTRLAVLVGRAKQAGSEIGDALIKGVVAAATAGQRAAVAAAADALSQARQAAEEQVTEAIRSARENFESLGDDLSSQIAEIIDVGPIGQRLKELEAELEAFQDRVTRRQLDFNVDQAQESLRDFRESIAGLGEQTPEQKAALGEALRPFKENVADAKAEVKEFNLTEMIEQQEDLAEAAKKAAEEGIQVLIDQFQAGKLTAGQFERALNAELTPAFKTLNSAAGKNLGLSFTQSFLQNVKNLVDQAKALTGFLDRSNTAPGSGDVVRPSQAISEGQAQVQSALASYKAARADLQQETNRILKQIRDARTGERTEKKKPGGSGIGPGGPGDLPPGTRTGALP